MQQKRHKNTPAAKRLFYQQKATLKKLGASRRFTKNQLKNTVEDILLPGAIIVGTLISSDPYKKTLLDPPPCFPLISDWTEKNMDFSCVFSRSNNPPPLVNPPSNNKGGLLGLRLIVLIIMI